MILNELLAPGDKKSLAFRSDRRALDKSSQNKIKQIYDPIVEHILTDCSDYVAAMRTAQFVCYRGLHSEHPIFMGRSLNNRRSRDSDVVTTQLFNNALTKLGIKANRSNSIFVTSSFTCAASYGGNNNVYVIFPRNTANYCWTKFEDLILGPTENFPINNNLQYSPEYKDLIKRIQELPPDEYIERLLISAKRLIEVNLDDIFDDVIFDIETHFDGPPVIDKSGMTKLLDRENPELFKYFEFDENMFIEKFEPSDTDFHIALSRSKEILVNGEYIAINNHAYTSLQNHYKELPKG